MLDGWDNAPCHIQHSSGTPTTGLRERGNNTSKSTGRSGRQKAATRRNMRREERVTVSNPTQHAKARTGDCPGPRKEPDGMSHRGALDPPTQPPWTSPFSKDPCVAPSFSLVGEACLDEFICTEYSRSLLECRACVVAQYCLLFSASVSEGCCP